MRKLRGLEDSVVISITEFSCREDDCPDIETVVGIMRPGATIQTIRMHWPLKGALFWFFW